MTLLTVPRPMLDLVAQGDAAATSAASATSEVVLFWVFAAIALGSGLAMLAMRNIVHAALMLVVNFFAISALYLGLQSPFLSIVQIIVYAGAIMVLFLFVIMLLGVDRDDTAVGEGVGPKVGAVLLSLAVTGAVLFAVMGTFTGDASACGEQVTDAVRAEAPYDQAQCVGLEALTDANEQGNVGTIGERLFTRYTFAFELAAVLLTVATLGAMVLGRRKDVGQDEDSAWQTDVHLPSVDDAEALLSGVAPPASVREDDADLAAQGPDIDATAIGDLPGGTGPDQVPYYDAEPHSREETDDGSPYNTLDAASPVSPDAPDPKPDAVDRPDGLDRHDGHDGFDGSDGHDGHDDPGGPDASDTDDQA